MRKRWKVLPLAAMATVMVQFSFVGAPQAQTTSGLVGGSTGGALTAGTTGSGGTVGGTTAGATTGGVAPTPIAVQPRFTG